MSSNATGPESSIIDQKRLSSRQSCGTSSCAESPCGSQPQICHLQIAATENTTPIRSLPLGSIIPFGSLETQIEALKRSKEASL